MMHIALCVTFAFISRYSTGSVLYPTDFCHVGHSFCKGDKGPAT